MQRSSTCVRRDAAPSAMVGQQSSAWLKGSAMLGQHWLGLHEKREGQGRERSPPQEEGPTRYLTNVGCGASHCRMALQERIIYFSTTFDEASGEQQADRINLMHSP